VMGSRRWWAAVGGDGDGRRWVVMGGDGWRWVAMGGDGRDGLATVVGSRQWWAHDGGGW
jgi:hypothetical protein